MLAFARIVADVASAEVKIWCNSVNQGRFPYATLATDQGRFTFQQLLEFIEPCPSTAESISVE